MRPRINQSYEFGPFRLDASERVLLRNGDVLPLTAKAFHTLLVLVENSGHIVERDELMQKVWPDTFVEEGNLSVTVSMLRKALGDNSGQPVYIATVAGRGYRFIAGVTDVQDGISELILEKQTRSHLVIDEEEENGELIREASSDPLANLKQVEGNIEFRQAPAVDATAIASKVAHRQHTASWFRSTAALAGVAVMIATAAWSIARLNSKSTVAMPRIVPLTTFPGSETQASFSPDAKEIAFVWDGEKRDNWDIYVKLIDAGTPLRLTTNPAPDTDPEWSPDGRYIAFLRRGAAGSAVYLVPSLGGAERKLAEVSVINYGSSLDWSPDGKFLAVVNKNAPQKSYSIFSLSVETGEKRQLTFPSAEYNGDTSPAFSPDGQTLAFIRIGSLGVSEIYLAPIAERSLRRLTFDNATLVDLAWTSDGRELVFRSNRGGFNTLWRIPVSGGAPGPLSAVGEDAIEPAISRQGHRLVYTRRTMDSNIWQIEKSNSASQVNSPSKVISSTRIDVSPQFSPNGKRIAFASDRSGSLEIWVCDSDGLNPIQLTSFGGAHTGTPRWSPDSQRIAFDSRPEGQSDVYVINAEGGKPRRLTLETSEDVAPSWSRDGGWIYFASNRNGDWQVWKAPAEGGEPVQVTKKGGFAATESPDGKLIYYAKNRDVPGPLWRMPVEGGEELPVPRFTRLVPWGQWAVLDRGIYFVNAESHSAIEFFSFDTGQVNQIAALEKRIPGGPSLSVSSDGRWILYAQIDRNDSDLMLVENFR